MLLLFYFHFICFEYLSWGLQSEVNQFQGEITQLTFYVLLMSQDQAGLLWLLNYFWIILKFFYFNCYHHFLIALFHPLLTDAFSLVFIDFTLLNFSFCSSTLSTLFHLSFVFCLFLCEHIFLNFLVVLSGSFFGFLVVSGFYFFSWKFLAAFMLWDYYFLLQCNLILNFFWLTSSGGFPNYTLQCLIPQGTHK